MIATFKRSPLCPFALPFHHTKIMEQQTIQEMVSYLEEKGVVVEYGRSFSGEPSLGFIDSEVICFDSGISELRTYLEGMVKAVDLMSSVCLPPRTKPVPSEFSLGKLKELREKYSLD
jgi:hypothetical protein